MEYREQTAKVLKLRDSKVFTPVALGETSKMLQLNPEFNAVWNYRRDIIQHLYDTLNTDFWDKELKFTMSQLKAYPKVYWIWNHRVWCLNQYPGSPTRIWLFELAIVDELLKMDARNFHGWHYRRFVVDKLENLTGENMNLPEFGHTKVRINENISNFSAWHRRAQLIPDMFKQDQIKDKKKFVNQELEYITNAMFTDAEDQSVWVYIKWFIKDGCIVDQLEREKYMEMLDSLAEKIRMINDDEVEFSGKDNVWCLKTLIVIENIQKNDLCLEIQPHATEYLKKLIKVDPLRKNRYLYLLEKE